MKPWKVILAAFVIFLSGLITGAVVDKQLRRNTPSTPGPAWPMQRMELMRRMERDLELTPEQRERIEQLFKESHQRLRKLWEPIDPKVKEELKAVGDRIRKELNPDQVRKFDELLTQPPLYRGGNGHRRGGPPREDKPQRPEPGPC